MTINQTPASTSDARKRLAEAVEKMQRAATQFVNAMNEGQQQRDIALAVKYVRNHSTPPPVSSPVDLIPVGHENAKPLVVNGVVGTYYRIEGSPWVSHVGATGGGDPSVMDHDVRTVTPLHGIPPELAEEIKTKFSGLREDHSDLRPWNAVLADVAEALR